MKRIALLCAVAAAACFAPLSSRAATYTSSGQGFMGSQDFLWSNPFNWVGAAAPQTGETNIIIVLPNNASPRTTTNDVAGLVVKSIRFQGDNYIVAGKAPGNVLALTFDRFSGDSIEVTGNNCQFAPTLSLLLTNDISVDVAPAKTFNLRSSMSGPGGLTKLDAGTLHLNSPGNSYLGDTSVSDGIVDLECGLFGPTTAIPGPLSIGSTNLLLSPVVRLLNDDQIADTAPVTVNANAKLWLNTHDDVLGSLTLAGGLINTGLGGGTATPGILQLNGNVTNHPSPVVNFATVSGKLSLGAFSRTFNVTGGQLGINAAISGVGLGNPGLTKIGPGTLTLYSATNTYVGPTLVQEGVLDIAASTQPLGTTNSGTTVSAGAQLVLESVVVGQEALTLNGAVTNDALVFAGSNSWSGPVSMSFARIYGATNETMHFSGPVSGGTFKATGRGNIYFTGTNANTVGDLIVDRGNVYLAKSPNVDAFGDRIFIGNTNDPQLQAYVIVKASQQFPTLAPTTIFPSGTLITDNADEALGHLTLQGGRLVNLGGKFILNGNVTNLFSPYNAFMAGDLVLANFQRTFHCAANSTLYCGSTISDPGGSGGITKTGPGRLILADPNTYSGPTIVQDGFLVLEEQGLPGSSAGGTEIFSPAVLQLEHAHVTNELLTLHGNAANYSLYVRDGCTWIGNVALLADSIVQFENANGLTNVLELGGAISGPGGLRTDGDGELILSGSSDNTFAGPLWVRSSSALLQKTSGAQAVGSSLRIGETNGPFGIVPTAALGGHNQIANSAPVEVLDNGLFHMNSFNDAIGALTMSGGNIYIGASLLTLNGNITAHAGGSLYVNVSLGGVTRTIFTDPNTRLSFYGDIQDGGAAAGITITGGGRVSFNYKTTYGGPTLVNASTLDLNNSATPGSSANGTQVSAGGHLKLLNARVTNETVVLFGDAGSSQLTFETDSNVWSGPIQLLGNTTFEGLPQTIPSFAPAKLWINGVISGTSGLTFDGQGDVTLRGDAGNTYAGTTTVRSGNLYLGKNSAVPNNVAIPASLVVGTTNTAPSMSTYVRTTAANQFATGAALQHTYRQSGHLTCNGFDQHVPALALFGATVGTVGGLLSLDGDVTVGGGTFESSLLDGRVSLGLSASNGLRTLTISNVNTLDLHADTGNGPNTSNLLVTAGGGLFLYGSNSFTGALTVENGALHAYNSDAFGQATGPTIVQTNGFVSLLGLGSATNPVAEPFIFVDTQVNAFSMTAYYTNYLSGPITLQGLFVCDVPLTNYLLVLSGPVSGAGWLWLQEGSGTLRLSGTNANTFSGELDQAYGKLELAKTNANAIAGPLTVGGQFGAPGDVIARWFQSNQVADTSAVFVGLSGQIELQNRNETIGSLAGPGNVLLGSAALTTGGDGTSTAFTGFISGIGGQLFKTGAGTMTLSGNNSYTGGSTVNDGVLLVNGQQPQSPVSLLTGGQVGGNGRVGNISALNGHVAPGASPGKLACANLSFFSPSSLLKIEIAGTNAGVTYDQVEASGSVLLMGGALQVAMKFAGAISNEYRVVKNDGASPVSGTFTGLPNNSSITNGGVVFVVKYNGGDGNDIVLVQQNVAPPSQIGGIQPLGPGRMQISGVGTPNTTYNVEAAGSLNAPIAWTVIGSVLSDGAGLMSFVDNDVNNHPMRFYRFALP